VTIALQEVAMGKLIVFYVPASFPLRPANWLSPLERGKIIEFHAKEDRKSA
jgi:hypothetical protein